METENRVSGGSLYHVDHTGQPEAVDKHTEDYKARCDFLLYYQGASPTSAVQSV